MLFLHLSGILLFTIAYGLLTEQTNLMNSHFTIRSITEAILGKDWQRLPYEQITGQEFVVSPAGSYKVNFRLRPTWLLKGNGYLHQTKIQEVLGYREEGTEDVIVYYLLVDRNEALIQRINEDIGQYFMAAGHGLEDVEIQESYFCWKHEGFTVDLLTHVSAFDNYKPYRNYYLITISKYHWDSFR